MRSPPCTQWEVLPVLSERSSLYSVRGPPCTQWNSHPVLSENHSLYSVRDLLCNQWEALLYSVRDPHCTQWEAPRPVISESPSLYSVRGPPCTQLKSHYVLSERSSLYSVRGLFCIQWEAFPVLSERPSLYSVRGPSLYSVRDFPCTQWEALPVEFWRSCLGSSAPGSQAPHRTLSECGPAGPASLCIPLQPASPTRIKGTPLSSPWGKSPLCRTQVGTLVFPRGDHVPLSWPAPSSKETVKVVLGWLSVLFVCSPTVPFGPEWYIEVEEKAGLYGEGLD